MSETTERRAADDAARLARKRRERVWVVRHTADDGRETYTTETDRTIVTALADRRGLVVAIAEP